MFASRQMFGAVQRRAFSASTRQVSLSQELVEFFPLARINCWQKVQQHLLMQRLPGVESPLYWVQLVALDNHCPLLLKLNPRVSELALYDIRGGPGRAVQSINSTIVELTEAV